MVMAYIVMVHVVIACIVMAYIVMVHVVMACIVMAYIVMVHVVMACIVMACIVVAYVAMAYVVMAYIVMAYIVMAYILMACRCSGIRPKGRSSMPSTTAQNSRMLAAALSAPFFRSHLFPQSPRSMPAANADGPFGF